MPLIIFPFAISVTLNYSPLCVRMRATHDGDVCYIDISIAVSAVNRQLRSSRPPARPLVRPSVRGVDFTPIFSVRRRCLARKHRSVPSTSLSSRKKSRDARNRRKKKAQTVGGERRKKDRGGRGSATSQRKMDFREVRASLNTRKMSKRVEE